MKIVIIGGTGRIGSLVVGRLRAGGHQAIPAAPNTGVNTLTGEGLAEALDGADVVVDVSNSPSFEDAAVLRFFETSTRNLLAAEAVAGVRHHVVLSVVGTGTEGVEESGYFRAKVVQENLIRDSSRPYSIVRATQFYEFIRGIADTSTVGDTVRVPAVLIQPMAAEDVASAVAQVAVGAPVNGVVEVAGPERFRLDELVRQRLLSDQDRREVIADPDARYFGARLREQTLLPGDGASLARTRFDTWLNEAQMAAR
ncbi:MAG TPA: NAD(P)H-binding protein [Longimicrobiaceae bacterium]